MQVSQMVASGLVVAGLIFLAAFASYRNQIPRPDFLIKADLRRRWYPNGSSVYYLQGSPVPWHMLLFLKLDMRELETDTTTLSSVTEYVQGLYKVADTPELREALKNYGEQYNIAYIKSQGRVERVKSMLGDPPCDYCQELFFIERKPQAVRQEMSF